MLMLTLSRLMGELIRAKHIVIAGRVLMLLSPSIPGSELVKHLDDVFAWEEITRICSHQVGAGYIAVELAESSILWESKQTSLSDVIVPYGTLILIS